jgi:Domain of unknown function (DUF4333)
VRCNTPLLPTAAPSTPTATTGPTTAQPTGQPTGPTTGQPTGQPTGPTTGQPTATAAAGPTTRPAAGQPAPTATARATTATATGAPGSSRSRAAAVQPPGYGMDAGDPEPPQPATPIEDPHVARRVALVGALLVLAVLVAGGVLLWLTRPRYLDSAALQRQIADQLTGRLGGPVAVRCPDDQRRRAGVTFRCTATDDAGGRRAVTVTVVDNSGNYTWTLGTA